ncbi:hypothetical protein [Nocardioides sp.]|uniref:hypothetical protein n=1 Tax=Nocardioides sp. TaxID=35761 RepID=UPI0035298351
MSRDHKKPMMAFVIVAVACAVLVVNAARSSAVDLLRDPVPSVAAAQAWRLVPGAEQLRRDDHGSVATATDPGASRRSAGTDGDQASRPTSGGTGAGQRADRAASSDEHGSDDRRNGHAASTGANDHPVTAGSGGTGSDGGAAQHPGHAPDHGGEGAGPGTPVATPAATDSGKQGRGPRHDGRSDEGRSHEGHRRGHDLGAAHEHRAAEPADHARGGHPDRG